jgi:hypothetical protein
MARLAVEAISAERSNDSVPQTLRVFVSVSIADTGEPVTGLDQENFRVTYLPNAEAGPVKSVVELMWTNTQDWCGCYLLFLHGGIKHLVYRVGLQVLVFTPPQGGVTTPKPTHQGQTVFEIKSLSD